MSSNLFEIRLISSCRKLKEKLIHNEKLKKDKEIFLKADRTIPYGFVVDVMADLKEAGVEQLGMLTESPPLEDE